MNQPLYLNSKTFCWLTATADGKRGLLGGADIGGTDMGGIGGIPGINGRGGIGIPPGPILQHRKQLTLTLIIYWDTKYSRKKIIGLLQNKLL